MQTMSRKLSFAQTNASFLQNPLIQSFLQHEEHKSLFLQAIESDDPAIHRELDHQFAVFYLKVRLIQYTNKVARFHGVKFDQRKRKQRGELLLDHTYGTEEGEDQQGLGDTLVSPSAVEEEASWPLEEWLPTPRMKQIWETFTEQKKQILALTVRYEWSTKAIASYFGCSTQNVSKLRRQLRQQLQEAYHYDEAKHSS